MLKVRELCSGGEHEKHPVAEEALMPVTHEEWPVQVGRQDWDVPDVYILAKVLFPLPL